MFAPLKAFSTISLQHSRTFRQKILSGKVYTLSAIGPHGRHTSTDISLRNDLPICARPNGSAGFRAAGCAVKGPLRRVRVDYFHQDMYIERKGKKTKKLYSIHLNFEMVILPSRAIR